MSTRLIEQRQLDERQRKIASRGLNCWPIDGPEDLLQVHRFRLWLNAAQEQETLEHPQFALKLPVQQGFSPRLAYYFAVGDYEQSLLQLIDSHVIAGDRVVECGGGTGITGALAAAKSDNSVVIVEPNEALHEQIKKTLAVNGQTAELILGAVVSDSYGSPDVVVGIREELWCNLTRPPEQGLKEVKVASIGFSSLLASHLPTVLVMDVDGMEGQLFPASLPDSLRLIIVTIHTPELGDARTAEVVNAIMAQGFVIRRILAQTWLFEKVTAHEISRARV